MEVKPFFLFAGSIGLAFVFDSSSHLALLPTFDKFLGVRSVLLHAQSKFGPCVDLMGLEGSECRTYKVDPIGYQVPRLVLPLLLCL